MREHIAPWDNGIKCQAKFLSQSLGIESFVTGPKSLGCFLFISGIASKEVEHARRFGQALQNAQNIPALDACILLH
jgi:hypothetical protein